MLVRRLKAEFGELPWWQQNLLGKPEVVVQALGGISRLGCASLLWQQKRLCKCLVSGDLAVEVLGGSRAG